MPEKYCFKITKKRSRLSKKKESNSGIIDSSLKRFPSISKLVRCKAAEIEQVSILIYMTFMGKAKPHHSYPSTGQTMYCKPIRSSRKSWSKTRAVRWGLIKLKVPRITWGPLSRCSSIQLSVWIRNFFDTLYNSLVSRLIILPISIQIFTGGTGQ